MADESQCYSSAQKEEDDKNQTIQSNRNKCKTINNRREKRREVKREEWTRKSDGTERTASKIEGEKIICVSIEKTEKAVWQQFIISHTEGNETTSTQAHHSLSIGR